MRPDHVLAIDQGTTSTRAILFDSAARVVAIAQREFPQHYPERGWVEHDPEDIWRDTLAVARDALAKVDVGRVAGIGITNQRETVVVWDRSTGEPIHRAIVWQDRRTAEICEQLKARRRGGRGSREDRPSARPLFLGDQDRLDPRPCRRERASVPSAASLRAGRSTASCCGG